ncbi:hypothetical protein [Sphingobium sp. WCS2017Hpa-17]|uniref:hypothetical protein n=1 Tax=Sphingobium sp. WCS2017Hpa-17 TaxID=3073638 RepID=UPI00288A5C23|nr:hypothetical protein [Sphingobium sp. WCS2017Hpa-17]
MPHSLALFRKRPIAISALLAFSALGLGGTLWACADSSCEPDWQMESRDFDCGGRAAISPGNDTRINLLLLMRSLKPVQDAPSSTAIDPYDPQFGRTFFSWSSLRTALWPQPAPVEENPAAAPVCEPSVAGIPAFAAALAADKSLTPAERTALGGLRAQTGCGEIKWDDSQISSKAGRDYQAYLKAADAFYRGDWTNARQGFGTLTRAHNPWIAETATYMPIRIGLRAAIAKAVDEYGDFAGSDKVDQAGIAEARNAIAAYLKAYPKGRYAASAQGLTRRVAWLSGDMATLIRRYEALLAATPGDAEAAADLAEEIDIKLLEREDARTLIAGQDDIPLLLAVADLKRMRQKADDPAALSPADLAAQKDQFTTHPDLYGLLQATRSYYAGENPRAILAMLPDAAREKRYTPLAFSRQVLRGMALGQARDVNEAGFWRELLDGASPFYQRPLVEMGLAIRWQRDGRIDQIFSPDSPISDTTTRSILLQTVATPAILRISAKDAARPARERDVARFTLLYKDLTRGAYGDFAGDLALVPANADSETGLWGFSQQDKIPVGLFIKGKWSDGFACPAIAQTAATLAHTPRNDRAQLCLGDFYRLNGFDGFDLFGGGTAPLSLGHGPDGFSGRSRTRGDIYAAIIADKGAAAEDRAYALYRAVMCYAPSGANGCAPAYSDYKQYEAAQSPKSDRKAWFTELKQRYPDSQWAKALRYYW